MAVVSTHLDDGIAVVTIDNPPVNMGNAALRRELQQALLEIANCALVTGVVLASARDHFYSGSDIREFDGEIQQPSLPEVIQILDSLDIPVVAALRGMTLGGGLELALGCDARLAEPSARLGLPETTLGMLPGAGGTVRLPRLVGVARAIEMISTGRPISAPDARAVGLIDEIVPKADLLERAIVTARTISKRRVRLLVPPASDAMEVAGAAAKALRDGRARPNVVRAVDLIQSGVETGSEQALAAERTAFDELRVGAEARNLRYLFFAKRAAAKGLASEAAPLQVSKVGIAGAGTMGSAIAAVCLRARLDVVLFDVDEGVLARARAALVERARSGDWRGRLTSTTDLASFADADIVIDAVFEDMTVKTSLLTQVEQVVSPRAVLASNTSYLNLDEISKVLQRPGRLAGLHFFNPADRNPLVEVIRTATSEPETLATLASLVRTFGKTGIGARVGEGFIANRVYADYRGQAEFIVEDGAGPQDVDAAMVAFGFAIGPFAVGDMSGLDIAWARRKRLASARDPRQRYVAIPDVLCEQGRLGKKTGAGWYAYPGGASRGVPDPAVDEIIAAARQAKGIGPSAISAEEIQQRILCSMLVAAAVVVQGGVAQRAADVDVALTEGFAFPAWQGGPVRYAAGQPDDWVINGLGKVYESDPIGFELAGSATRGEIAEPIEAILSAVARSDGLACARVSSQHPAAARGARRGRA
jgi:3-hydroxyacyl-CoA dehydrogenase